MMGDFGMGTGFSWIFWLALIIGAVLLVRGGYLGCGMGHSGRQNNDQNETPLSILKRRYAKGEISKEEFDRMKNDLI